VAGYRVLILRPALDELEAIDRKKDRQRIVRRIAALAGDPRPRGCEKLSGSRDRFRIRQGDYRIVYAVDDAQATVTVVRIGHRRDVYR
jgi:mRNA interferase RelE/StbE